MKNSIGSVSYVYIIIKIRIYALPLTIFLELDNASGEETSINNDVYSNNKSFAPELAYVSLIIKDSNDLQQTTKNYYSDINHSYDYYSGGLGN